MRRINDEFMRAANKRGRAPFSPCNKAEREAVWLNVAEAVSEAMDRFAQTPDKKQNLELSFFEKFDWVKEFIHSEISNPSVLDEYSVYQYHHIDCLEFMPTAAAVLQDVPNGNEVLNAIQTKFRSSGWEGDGEIQLMWIPPFIGAGVEDTWGVAVWFVKQSNNGTAFLASPVKLPFSRLLDQQR